jgi:hypothetical protein
MINPFTHRKILKKGMPGRGTIVSMAMPARGASSSNVPMTLQIQVEGLAPYEVEDQWMVSSKDTLGFGMALPVKVDRDDPNKVAIDWAQAREEHEAQTAARREALASQGPVAAGGAVDPAAIMGGAAAMQGASPVIDMRNDPELRRKIEKIVGHELTPGSSETVAENDPAMQMQILQVVQQHMAEKAAGGAGGSGGDSDDTIAQLERLNELRESGALTKKEFEEQKKRILGTG